MTKRVKSSQIDGEINAPASKSEMIRVVAAALLASGTSKIINPSFCSDGLTALGIADTLGAEILKEGDSITIEGNASLKEKCIRGNTLDCGESGLCIRMFAPVSGLLEEEITLNASGSLLKRPLKMVEALTGLGATCLTDRDFAPVQVKGRIGSGRININGFESSQFLTGLLVALPLCSGDSDITVTALKSKPYIELTIDTMRRFGVAVSHNNDLTEFHIKGDQHYKPCMCAIEGDWSGAAFFLVAGALAGSIKVKGLSPDSYQADKAVIEALIKAGAQVEVKNDYIFVAKDRLNAFEFDAGDCPDLFPPLVALGAGCAGKSVIYGVERLKHKESNRGLALVEEFSKIGIKIRIFEDRMEITGGNRRGGTVDSHNDHRIAMACAIAALAGQGDVIVERPACVSKSFPSFFEDLNSVKVKHE
ncbi:MAG: 3-phosphoshikimate 1-carboxyvinyltransferase [Proteobacteria bacterium]|nr:3-phosphoshikimate 1-carboxyvinyltransferase [Pseudomonadota bacterium]